MVDRSRKELEPQILGVSTGTAARATQDCGGGEGERPMRADKRPISPGPYTRTQAGYNCKYDEALRKMVQAYDDVRERG